MPKIEPIVNALQFSDLIGHSEIIPITAKRILERLGIQTSYFFGVYMACFFLSRNYWSSLDHDLIATI